MEFLAWLFLVLIVILIIIIVLIFIFYQPNENDICSEDKLATEEEAWGLYQTDQLTENPFYLVAPEYNGPYSLTLKSIPKPGETCVGCNSRDIPFPAYCLVKGPMDAGIEYELLPGQTDSVRTYQNGELEINLGENCQTSSNSLKKGYPVPKWYSISSFKNI